MFGKNYIRSWLEELGEKKAVKNIIKEYLSAEDCQPAVPAKTLEKKLLGEEVILIYKIEDDLFCLIAGKLNEVKNNLESIIKGANRFRKGDHSFVFLYNFTLDTDDSVSKFYCEKGRLFWNIRRGLNNNLPADSWPTGIYCNDEIYLIAENLRKKVITITI